jgi:PEP-CTERM motif
MKSLTSIAVLTSAMTLASAAHASYFIRPYVTLGGSIIDGYDGNGATQGSVNFTNALQAVVDLATGTTKNYVSVTGPSVGGSGVGSSAGVFGDRVRFTGGQGSNAGFSFAFDGTIKSPARTNVNSFLQIGLFATLRVFNPGSGATYLNFVEQPNALISKTLFLQFNNPTEDLDEMINQTLADSLTITGNGIYDVFGSLAIFASLNDNAGTVEMDFLHTGTFGIQTDPGVSFTSDSGVFLGSGLTPGAVPEPASWALMIAGFGLVGSAVRRRRTGGTAQIAA